MNVSRNIRVRSPILGQYLAKVPPERSDDATLCQQIPSMGVPLDIFGLSNSPVFAWDEGRRRPEDRSAEHWHLLATGPGNPTLSNPSAAAPGSRMNHSVTERIFQFQNENLAHPDHLR